MDETQRKEVLRRLRAGERAKVRAELPMEPERLRAMFDMLDRDLPVHGCDHTRRLTQRWLEERHLAVSKVLSWLDTLGGFCDCEVLANVEPVVEDATEGADP